MAGNTGKMTKAAIRARRPRPRLARVYADRQCVGLAIFSAERSPVSKRGWYRFIATSYSLRYLLGIARSEVRHD